MSVQGSGAAEGTAGARGRRRPVWLRAISGVLVSLLVVVAGILAVRADGEPVHDVALTDGSIWVSGGRSGYWARVNTGAHGFDLVMQGAESRQSAATRRPDILQDGRNAVGVTSDLRLVAFDSRTGEPIDGEVQVPPPTYATGVDFHEPGLVAMHGNTLAVVDQATGRVWAKRLDPKGGTPIGDLLDTGELATAGPNASVTVDVGGDVMVVSAETGTVVEIPADGAGFGSPERTDLGFTGGRAADITAVGDAWVVLDLEKGEIHAEGLDKPQGLPGESQDTAGVTLTMAALQQAGPTSGVVGYQTRERAGFVRITEEYGVSDGEVGVISGMDDTESRLRYQRISEPVVNGDCLYAAWGDGDAVRWGAACGTVEVPAVELSISGTFSRRHGVAVRHNRGQVLLNDLDTGHVYDLSLTGDLRIDAWPADPSGDTPQVWVPGEAPAPTSTSKTSTSTATKTSKKTTKTSKKKTSKKKSSSTKSTKTSG
ncbi:hypothetical protein [Janibacter limosus]|uniref:hypothetical protein n=1 Tax=Janibacter limosus TaxID=53458 RepID=UPI0008316D45|nr:hypothetical protein [Janibacter limosus]